MCVCQRNKINQFKPEKIYYVSQNLSYLTSHLGGKSKALKKQRRGKKGREKKKETETAKMKENSR